MLDKSLRTVADLEWVGLSSISLVMGTLLLAGVAGVALNAAGAASWLIAVLVAIITCYGTMLAALLLRAAAQYDTTR